MPIACVFLKKQLFLTLLIKKEVFFQGLFQYIYPNPKETADLGTFTAKILNEKLDILCTEVAAMRLEPTTI